MKRGKFDLFIRLALLASLGLSAYGFGQFCADMYVLNLKRTAPAVSGAPLERAPLLLPTPK